MKNLLFCLLVGLYTNVSLAQSWNYQNRNPLWTMVIYSGLKPSEVKAQFPHLPIAEGTDEAAYTKAFTNWMFEYPDEWKRWETHPTMQKNNLGWVYSYIGKSVPESLEQDGFAQFVKALRLSENRLKQLAPNYPQQHSCKAIQKWIENHPLEFDALVRCQESESLSPQLRISYGITPGITAQSYRIFTTLKPEEQRYDSTETNKTQILQPSSPTNNLQPE
ncbi:MAG: hypothetical protein NZ108_07225 [Bacteroidia bacterium]|nr:hypothetical protein [Bacteroidia bacterium]